MDKEEMDRRVKILMLRAGLDPNKPPPAIIVNDMSTEEAERRLDLLRKRLR